MEKSVGDPKKEKVTLKARVEELTGELEAERKKSNEYLTRLKYLQADFENYEKRVKREREEVIKMSSEQIVKKLLSVLDDMELAAAEGRKIKGAEMVTKGLEMILANLTEILAQEGVAKIDALNKPFDPSKHEAASFIENDEVEENIVVRELRKGYTLNGRVVRPSVVEVARKTVKTGSESPSEVEAKL